MKVEPVEPHRELFPLVCASSEGVIPSNNILHAAWGPPPLYVKTLG